MKFILKPWDIRKSRLAAMDMHAAELGASVQGREDFTGIEQAFRVERAFKALLLLQVAFIKHRPHKIAFFDANAMFAGQNTADFNTQL